MSQVKAMSAVERIESLLDAGSFIEIGASVHARNTDFNMPEKQTPADGVITGYVRSTAILSMYLVRIHL